MIPVNEPFLGEQELEYVADCIKTGWISSAGKYIDRFEDQWAAYCGREYGVAVSNGTTALQIACHCLDLKPGDEVIIPDFTIISCAQAVMYEGGKPVFVDANPDTWTMDVDQVAESINSKTRAILPVHIYGHPVDMDPILDLAEDHNLVIIEDAAEAHGAEYQSKGQWKRCGSFGDMSCFSFYANKLVTTGEGGMVMTDDIRLAEQLRSLRNLCFQPGRRFFHEELGYNFRMTNMQAAIGCAQVERMDKIVAKKRWMGEEYTRLLKNISELQLPVEKPWAKSVYWMYGIILKEVVGMDATECAKMLSEKGVETRPFFLGMHEEPVLQKNGIVSEKKFPISSSISRNGFYLPSGCGITTDQIKSVTEILRGILA